MTNTRLEDIRSQLETELECSEAEVGRLKAELDVAETEYKKVKNALTALGKNGAPSPKKKTVKQADVRKAVYDQLRDQPSPVPCDELEAALRDAFTRKGFALTGFTQRLAEVLKDENITQSDAGVCLTSSKAAAR